MQKYEEFCPPTPLKGAIKTARALLYLETDILVMMRFLIFN
jgi:hypothetical protein